MSSVVVGTPSLSHADDSTQEYEWFWLDDPREEWRLLQPPPPPPPPLPPAAEEVLCAYCKRDVSKHAETLGGDPRALVGCACKHKCSRAEKHAGIKKWVSFACDCGALMHEACWRVCLAATKKKGHCPVCKHDRKGRFPPPPPG